MGCCHVPMAFEIGDRSGFDPGHFGVHGSPCLMMVDTCEGKVAWAGENPTRPGQFAF